MHCPNCGSTDIADLLGDDGRICLDCDVVWRPR